MESRRVKTEISILKFYQMFHILLLFLIILCHFISVNKYFLIYNSLIFFFIISILIYIINFLFLLITTIFMFRKKHNPTFFNFLKNIAFIMIIFAVIKGLILTIIYWFNFYNFPKFIKNCPFNFSVNSLLRLTKNTKIEEKKCNLKRCIYSHFSKQNNNYIYLCNFNAENEPYGNSNEIDCMYTSKNEYYNSTFYSYLKKCDPYCNYYECSSKAKRHGKFFVQYNKKCPKKLNKKRFITLGILFPFIDLIADLIIWLFIYSQYKIILRFMNFEMFELLTRFSPSSLNSTRDCSIVKPNNNRDNILTQINIHQTEMIIYPPIEKNDNTNKIIKKGKQMDLKMDNNDSLVSSKNDFINDKNINTNTSLDYLK